MRHYTIIIYCAILVTAVACSSKQNGAVEGSVSPPNSSARITVTQDGKAVATVDVISADGKFGMALAPGKYDINVTVPSSPLPLSFPGVVVEPGKTTTLPPIDLSVPAGRSVLSGTIVPGGTATKVLLLYEGKERAAVNTTGEGKYEFIGLPAGTYTVQASSSGYADDTATINLGDTQRASQNIRLLYVSNVDGADWTTGKIRARGVGMPPKNAANATVSREMAKRAALADAQRNLLRVIDQVRVSPDQSLKSFMGDKTYRERIEGFVQGYRIAREQELGNRNVEIELELPLTGPSGLSTVIREQRP
jgi:hypothetical protein